MCIQSMSDPVYKYIDAKNRNLYDKLIERYQINLIKSAVPEKNGRNELWLCASVENGFNITYFEDIDSTAPLTHELLHIDLINKGFVSNQALIPHIKTGNKNLIFTPIVSHINNIYAHNKFYDLFLSLGYNESEFLSDYTLEITLETIKSKINCFNPMLPSVNFNIHEYIAWFYTVKDNKNSDKAQVFQQLLSFLQQTDFELFRILDNGWVSWSQSNSVSNEHFLTLLFDLVENWYQAKNISKNL